jgi:hypothetical protein
MRKPAVSIPVAVLVLNWNGRALTEACVASWMAARPRPRRLLVVDNGSVDGSVAALRRRFKGLELLSLPANLGFAAGNNRGFERLWSKGPKVEAVFVCNNDTEVRPDMLGLLWESLRAMPAWGAVGPRILFHGEERIWFEGGVIRPWTGRGGHLAYAAAAGPAGEAFELPAHGFVTGCGMLVRSSALRDLKGFDERLWAYAEDADLCLRMRERGLACGIVPRACMSHKISSSFGLGSPQSLYYLTRNSYALLRRHALGHGGLTKGLFSAVNVGLAGRAVLRGSPAAGMAILKGLRDGRRGLWPIYGSGA